MLFLIIFIFLFELSLHARLPMIGHDNPIWFDQLIIGKWHFAHQGIFPFRFSPHVCGGAPVYGDPETVYYSLAQALSLFIQPWFAMQISVITALIAGFYGWKKFGGKVLNLKSNWSLLLAMVMVANGFIFIHLAAGHFQMHTMPLIGVFLLLLFDRDHDSITKLLFRACAFALLALVTLNTAGYNVLLFTAIITAFFLPFDLLLSSDLKSRAQQLFKRIILAGILTLLVCFSRLVAVLSFMKYFPREEGYSKMWESTNVFSFMIKSFWSLFPTRDTIPGFGWDIHEKFMFLSPIVWIGLLLSLFLVFKMKDWIFQNIKKSLILFIYSLFTVLFLTQLVQGHGFLVDQFLQLPVIRSLRVASRFLFIFSIFISILSVISLSVFSSRLKDRWQKMIPLIAIILTIFPIGTGWYAVRHRLFLNENYTLRIQQINSLQLIHYQDLPVTEIKDGNTDFVRSGNKCHIELLRKSYPLPLQVGAAKQDLNGTFNLMNPACYQYPEENNCLPGDRIKLDDEENFENFTHGRPTTWKLSLLQQVADYTSLATMVALLGTLFTLWIRKKTV